MCAAQRFPESRLKCVGALLFLRFLCPAIIAPDGFGLIPAAELGTARRALTLVAKPIQNLANGVRFGKKEEFMIPLNEFVDRNTQALEQLLESASTVKQKQNYSISASISEEEQFLHLAVILKNFNSNKNGLIPALAKNPRLKTPEKAKEAEGFIRAALDKLEQMEHDFA